MAGDEKGGGSIRGTSGGNCGASEGTKEVNWGSDRLSPCALSVNSNSQLAPSERFFEDFTS